MRNDRKSYPRKNFNNRIDILGDQVPTMHKAKCDSCGKMCEVPFRPTNGKPVYCNTCFASIRAGSTTKRSDRRIPHYDENQMFTTTCDECGETCEVPFKSSNNKPVYCSDCFEKRGNNSGVSKKNSSGTFEKQLQEINQKLDTLLGILVHK